MNRLVLAATISMLSMLGTSHASTLDITLGSTVSYFEGGSPLTPNINLGTTPNLAYNNASIASNITPPGAYVIPSGTLANNDFLAVYGPEQSLPPGTRGTATFTFNSDTDLFGFTWGSIDRFNHLQITADINGTPQTFAINGSNILNHITGPSAGNSQENIVISDPFGTIISALFTTGKNSFEVANFAQEAPLPPALPMFTAALLGLAWLAHRRKQGLI